MTHVVGIAEPEPVLLEAEHVEPMLMEIAVELMSVSIEAALMQMTPHCGHGGDNVYILKMVVNNQPQVLVHGKHGNGIQPWQYIVVHYSRFLAWECVVVNLFHILLFEAFHRHHQYVGVDHHPDTWLWREQQFTVLERLAPSTLRFSPRMARTPRQVRLP